MTPESAAELVGHGVHIILLVVAVLVIPGLIGGLIVSIFQAATQINEQTLSFLPRLVITLVALVVAGAWIIQTLCDLFVEVFHNAGHMVG